MSALGQFKMLFENCENGPEARPSRSTLPAFRERIKWLLDHLEVDVLARTAIVGARSPISVSAVIKVSTSIDVCHSCTDGRSLRLHLPVVH